MDAVLARAGASFMGKSPVQLAAEEIAGRLEATGIDYAVAGALSLGYHGFERTTEDVVSSSPSKASPASKQSGSVGAM